MTKYSVKYAQNGGIFKEVALFSDNIPHGTLVRFCEDLLTEIDNCTAVEAVDLETGVIFYDVYAEEDPDNCDDDCGFDPYLGLLPIKCESSPNGEFPGCVHNSFTKG